MNATSWIQIGLYLALILGLARPLGLFMARVYEGDIPRAMRFLRPLERVVYRACGVRADAEMTWRQYAIAFLAFNAIGFIALFALELLQGVLPLNPQGLPGVGIAVAFNTAVSFVTNTNWQAYGGEATMSYLTQMAGLTVQNFVSAAAGMAVLVALIRGIARHSAATIGNFWVDMVRSVLYILLPLSVVLAIALVSQGVVQSFAPYHQVAAVESGAEQLVAVGPAASQVAIKQLGTNGGGFFNTNSAHPFENPTPLSNFLEMLAILLIPAALCLTFGKMVGDTRQGWAILAAMTALFVAFLAVTVVQEQAGGSMEGKDVRFGSAISALWATATTAASNGSVNAMHDSFTPLGGLVPLALMQLGEVVFGGVGSGLYGMLAFVLVAVFIAGLMVGRTPEYLGKKVETREIQMAVLMILICPIVVLGGTALAVSTEAGRATVLNPGPHGFSEILYALSSAGNNNGSAFAGLDASGGFYCALLAAAMIIARYAVAIPALALAGSLAAKKRVPAGSGTLPTSSPLFVLVLIGVVILVGALTFLPALALGPIAEAISHGGVAR